MATEIIMPKLSMTMKEGEITSWNKEEGETIEEGEILLEVLSDKANFEVEAPASGILLKKLYKDGDTVPVTAMIAVIGEEGEDISGLLSGVQKENGDEKEKRLVEGEGSVQIEDKETKKSARITASPAARRIAWEEKIDLSDITASGPGGRIIEADLNQFLENRKKVKTTPAARKIAEFNDIPLESIGVDEGQRIYKDDIQKIIAEKDKGLSSEKLKGIKKLAADKVTQSWKTTPHVTFTVEVDMTNTLELLNRINNHIEDELKIRVTDLLIKVIAQNLKKYPAINTYLDDDTIYYNKDINIGLAVDLDGELVVPVLKDVDQKNLKEIVKEKLLLVKKARSNQLTGPDVADGCFTLSNLGMYGIDIFTPIINPPESGILGVGQIKKKPVVINDEIMVKPMMWLSLSIDHRLIDGGPAAKFLNKIRAVIEQPGLLLL